jgi:FkbM family methyltransferase
MELRPNTLDAYVWREVRSYDPLDVGAGDLVLDVGLNIGAFAYRAAQRGARVVGYEPEPDNARLARVNTAGLNVEVREAAVVGDDQDDVVTLYLNPGRNRGAHTTAVREGDTGIRRAALLDPDPFKEKAPAVGQVQVKAVAWGDVLAEAPWTVIKIDIEGGEYELDYALLPGTVRALAVELHTDRQRWREVDKPRVLSQLAAWDVVKAPSAVRKRGDLAIWRR